MTAAVAVVTDSTAGLTTSLTSRYAIRVVRCASWPTPARGCSGSWSPRT